MVGEGDADGEGGFAEALGGFFVGLAGSGVARGVVVSEDDGGGAVGDGGGEDFSGVDETGGEGADSYSVPTDEAVGTVKGEEDEVFLGFAADVGEEFGYYFWRVDDGLVGGDEQSSAELERSEYLGDFGWAEAGDFGEFCVGDVD